MSIHTEGEPLRIDDMIRQCTTDSSRWFPGEAQSLPNLVLCMCGEAGEVANLVKKIVRGSMTVNDAMNGHIMKAQDKDTIQEEIVDVLIYLCNLMGAKEFKDIDWRAIWNAKRQFNENRFGKTSSRFSIVPEPASHEQRRMQEFGPFAKKGQYFD